MSEDVIGSAFVEILPRLSANFDTQAAGLIAPQIDQVGVKTSPQFASLGKKFSASLGSGLSGLGDKIGGEVGQVTSKIGGLFDSLSRRGVSSLGVISGVSAGAAGLGALLTHAGDKDKAARQQLEASIEATGSTYEDYSKQIEGAIKTQTRFGRTAPTVLDALNRIFIQAKDPTKAFEILNVATDVAAAKHISLQAAAKLVTNAANGNTKALKQFGITVADTTKLGNAATASDKARLAAQDKLKIAQRDHTRLLRDLSAGTKLTTREQISLRDATQRVADAQAKVDAATTPAKRALAVEQLAKAQQHLGDEQRLLGEKAQLTAKDQDRLRDSSDKVKQAQDELTQSLKNQKVAHSDLKSGLESTATVLQTIGTKVGPQAVAATDTLSGKLDSIKAKVTNALTGFGEKWGPELLTAGTAISTFTTILDSQLVRSIATATLRMLGFGTATAGAGAKAVVAAGEELTLAAANDAVALSAGRAGGAQIVGGIGRLGTALKFLGVAGAVAGVTLAVKQLYDTNTFGLKTGVDATNNFIDDSLSHLPLVGGAFKKQGKDIADEMTGHFKNAITGALGTQERQEAILLAMQSIFNTRMKNVRQALEELKEQNFNWKVNISAFTTLGDNFDRSGFQRADALANPNNPSQGRATAPAQVTIIQHNDQRGASPAQIAEANTRTSRGAQRIGGD